MNILPSGIIDQSMYLNSSIEVLIDEYFFAQYSYCKNNATHEFTPFGTVFGNSKGYIQPVTNLTVVESNSIGVEVECYEHAHVVISGNGDYDFKTPSGRTIRNWKFGEHNVENGYGYAPIYPFSVTFKDNFAICCILPTSNRNKSVNYKFEVLLGNDNNVTTNKTYKWMHVANKSVSLNGVVYNEKQTINNVASGSTINMIKDSIIIAAYIV